MTADLFTGNYIEADLDAMLDRQGLKTEAAAKLTAYLNTGLAGFFEQGWDRLNALGFDIDLRREPTEANARALLWIAQNR